MSKWAALAKQVKSQEDVKSLMGQIEDVMIRTGKMTNDMNKALDILTGIDTSNKDMDLMEPIEDYLALDEGSSA
jgi:hypothetical protein